MKRPIHNFKISLDKRNPNQGGLGFELQKLQQNLNFAIKKQDETGIDMSALIDFYGNALANLRK